MPKRTRSYAEWLGAELSDPATAAAYLSSAREDSLAMFFKALRKVAAAQSRPMTELAETVGVSRESLYRMMAETGNPSHENVSGILGAMGFKLEIVPILGAGHSGEPSLSYSESQSREPKLSPALKRFYHSNTHTGIAEKSFWPFDLGISQIGRTETLLHRMPTNAAAVSYTFGNLVSGSSSPVRELSVSTDLLIARNVAQRKLRELVTR